MTGRPNRTSGAGRWRIAFMTTIAAGVLAGCEAADRFDGPLIPPGPAPALAGARLWVDSTSTAFKYVLAIATSDPQSATQLRRIALQPLVPWFTEPDLDIREQVNDLVTHITSAGALPVFVVYVIPQRDCGAFSSGGAANANAYRSFISEVSRGIGARSAVVIMEPDGLTELDCLNASKTAERFALIREAVATLKRSGSVAVYIDAGHPRWNDAATMAPRLLSSGVDLADGFVLNTSNFIRTPENIVYGRELSALLGGKHFIIDTSRNGNGPAPANAWCNPAGRAIGESPTTITGQPLADAYLWIKTPGESDGECNGGPAAGNWWPEYALQLLRNTGN